MTLPVLSFFRPLLPQLRQWTRAWILCLMLAASVWATNFSTCLDEVRSGQWGTIGGTDNSGRPVSNISQATAITYDLCLRACGSGPERFNWNIFSQQFTAWLLPSLALASQLPFGARTRLDNLVSVLLTVGSPTLASYSLALTVLNGHWLAGRFSHLSYPNCTLKNHFSLHSWYFTPTITFKFWVDLEEWLNGLYPQSWSLSAVASILWVIIAYFFTVVDSFTGGVVTYSTLNSNGQAVGSVFLWMLPVVVAWLQISPKCDYTRVKGAINRANQIAFVATPDGEPTLASNISTKRAISLRKGGGDVHSDEHCTAPVFNYARFLPWTLAVEEVYAAFREASQKSESHQPVNGSTWERGDRNIRVRPANRQGSLPQVIAYIEPVVKPWAFELFDRPRGFRSRWGPGVLSRFVLASVLALGLTWGTIGAAIVGSYFVPTQGIGCRVGSYLVYGIVSTVVWMMLVASSILAHISSFTGTSNGRYVYDKSTRTAAVASIILRRTGKLLAASNAIWIVSACLFQFSSFFDRCLCNSSVFSLGKHAYNAIDLLPEDLVRSSLMSATLNAPWGAQSSLWVS
ncbi:hypothetical protein C8F04DRAFT_1191308 [Mycena alexandri]|uniref:Uncharacterized protein n=1 Tax=Mycena alexandri TaxID=1745969 RepID=A0AAD6SDC2_9AGAR|nr:hypothetical protein C8F04DRAFT_1191308 [Mycena alexandri]